LVGIARQTGWRRLLYIIGIALGLCLLVQQAWQGYWALQQAQTCVVRPSFLLVMLALYVLAYFVQLTAWALIMRSLHAPLAAEAVVEGYALSFLPRYIPGSVWGYLSRNEWLFQNYQVPYGVSNTASLIEAAMLLISAVMLGTLYWLPSGLTMLDWLPTIRHSPIVTGGIIVVGVVASRLVWQMTPRLTARFAPKQMQCNASGDPARSRGIRMWIATTLLYLVFWLVQGGALLTIAHALCGGLTLGLFAVTAATGLAWAIGFLIVFVPAGLGIREWTLGTLLVAFAALQPGQATLIAVVSRFGMIVSELLVLLIGLQAKVKRWWEKEKGETGLGRKRWNP
jgi:hypothetical protein